MSLMLILAILAGPSTVALKDKATVGGEWIRMTDLLDPDRTDARALERVADLYLGRAPDAGRTRIVTIEEVRRELERRGMDAADFAWWGDRVEVSSGAPAGSETLRKAIASEIKRLLLRQDPRLRSDEVSVRVVRLRPEPAKEALSVAALKPGAAGYVVTLSDGSEIEAVAGISRVRLAGFAARELAPGRALEAGDVEMRSVELPDGERPLGLSQLVGSVPQVRIERGGELVPAALRLRSVVRRGDVVRAVSSGYEVDARALEEGAVGQEIGLELLASRNRVKAQVASPSEAHVVEATR